MASMAKRFIPLMDRVLVQKVKPDVQTKTGIFLPDSAKGPANMAKVISVGSGRVTKTGTVISCSVKAGDMVVIPEYSGMTMKLDNEEFHVYREEDIVALIKE